VLGRLGFGDGLWVCSVGLAVGLWVVAVGDGWFGSTVGFGLMLGLDCGGFSGGSFDFVVFLVEGLIFVCGGSIHCMLGCWVLFCRVKYGGKWKKKKTNCFIIF
jgi:hypothetical protein